LLAKIEEGSAGSKKFEESVVDDLKWLKATEHTQYFRRNDAYTWVISCLAEKYTKAGDAVKATCFKGIGVDSAEAMNNELLNNIVKLLAKEKKTPFEEFALSVLNTSADDIIQIEAVNLLYQYKYKDAEAKLKEAVNVKGDSVYGDPFVIHINDNHDADASIKKKSCYTRRDFIQKMCDLEAKAESDPAHAADYYFQLGNGAYNMTYFGNNRVLYQTGSTYIAIQGWDFISSSKPQIDTTLPYISCSHALAYYLKAMQLSNDKEFKAKCCFMAAKCEQNRFDCSIPKDFKGDFKAGNYFKMLKQDYAATQYYKEIIAECGYFKTFAGK
jgi:hypothetical protein